MFLSSEGLQMDDQNEQELTNENAVLTALSVVIFEDLKKYLLDLIENLDQAS